MATDNKIRKGVPFLNPQATGCQSPPQKDNLHLALPKLHDLGLPTRRPTDQQTHQSTLNQTDEAEIRVSY